MVLLEALEQRILLSADHHILAAAVVSVANPATTVDIAATTSAAFLDAYVTPAATHLGAAATAGTIAGAVFDDRDGDGTRTTGELGAAGWTVFLDANHNATLDAGERQTVTGPAGNYSFANVAAGAQAVRIAPQAGALTTTGAGDVVVSVTAGKASSASFGVFRTIGIAGTVFDDRNANGIADAGEAGLGGQTVYLDRDDSATFTTGDTATTTLGDGSFAFANLGPGTYTVREVVPPHDAETTPAGGAFVVTAASGQSVTGAAFGTVALASVDGTVFEDRDGNGRQGTGEPGLKGWTLFLDANRNGLLDPGERSVRSDADGAYAFTDVRPGQVAIGEIAPAGWIATSAGGGSATVSARTVGSDVALVLPDAAAPSAVAPDGLDPDNLLAAALTGLDQYRADPRFFGYDGTGVTAAVVDTGIDGSSAFFGPQQNGVATKIVYAHDFADGTAGGTDENSHGSNVASIIAGNDGPYQGVAPGASLADLRVYTDTGAGTFAYVQAALDWVIANAAADHIVAVNLSLGDGGNWDTAVSRYGLGDDLARLAALDVIVVAAAGNNFYTFDSQPGVSYPASDPNVIGVGAVWDGDYGGPWRFASGAIDTATTADQIASFSQRDPDLVDIYAPGARLTGANASGGSITLQGTSQAAAFITGVATLAQDLALGALGRLLSPSEFAGLLRSSADVIVDDSTNGNVTVTGQSVPRVNVEALAEMILTLGGGGGGGPIAASSSQTVTLVAGQQMTDVDFANFRQGAVAGTVFDDHNGNGFQDDVDAGLAGRTVFIDANHNGVLDSGEARTTTGPNGAYAFTGLGPGTYRIDEVSPGGWSATTAAGSITVTSGLSASLSFGERQVPPGAPVLAALVDDTGVPGDGITRDAHVELAGTAARGATVTLYDGTVQVGTGTADAVTGRFDIVTARALADGTHSLTATATDPSNGLTSAASAPLAVTVDTRAPRGTSRPASATATALSFTVVFSEAMGPLTAGDFAVIASGSATAAVSAVTGSGTTYAVTLGSTAGTGTLRLALAGTAGDIAGNAATLLASARAAIAGNGSARSVTYAGQNGAVVTLIFRPDTTTTRTTLPDGSGTATVAGITGQRFTSYTVSFGTDGRPTHAAYSNGEAATWFYSTTGSFTLFYTGVQGQPYTGYTVAFDQAGRPTGASYSNGQAAAWRYAADGTSTKTVSGIVGHVYTSATFSFGMDGRATGAAYSDGETATWTYAPDGGFMIAYAGVHGQPYTTATVTHAADGKPVSSSFGNGVAGHWTYAPDGSVTLLTTGITGQPYTSRTLVFGSDGRPQSASFSNGEAAAWTYRPDGSGQVAHTGVQGQAYAAYTVQVDALGRPTSASYGDGMAATWVYRADGSVTQRLTGVTGQSFTSATIMFGTDGRPASASYSDQQTATWTYRPDGSFDRVVVGPQGTRRYSYDPTGKLLGTSVTPDMTASAQPFVIDITRQTADVDLPSGCAFASAVWHKDVLSAAGTTITINLPS